MRKAVNEYDIAINELAKLYYDYFEYLSSSDATKEEIDNKELKIDNWIKDKFLDTEQESLKGIKKDIFLPGLFTDSSNSDEGNESIKHLKLDCIKSEIEKCLNTTGKVARYHAPNGSHKMDQIGGYEEGFVKDIKKILSEMDECAESAVNGHPTQEATSREFKKEITCDSDMSDDDKEDASRGLQDELSFIDERLKDRFKDRSLLNNLIFLWVTDSFVALQYASRRTKEDQDLIDSLYQSLPQDSAHAPKSDSQKLLYIKDHYFSLEPSKYPELQTVLTNLNITAVSFNTYIIPKIHSLKSKKTPNFTTTSFPEIKASINTCLVQEIGRYEYNLSYLNMIPKAMLRCNLDILNDQSDLIERIYSVSPTRSGSELDIYKKLIFVLQNPPPDQQENLGEILENIISKYRQIFIRNETAHYVTYDSANTCYQAESQDISFDSYQRSLTSGQSFVLGQVPSGAKESSYGGNGR